MMCSGGGGAAAGGNIRCRSLDGDGVITREEWYAKYGTYDGFDQLDADGDGKIDTKEFMCQRTPTQTDRQTDRQTDTLTDTLLEQIYT